MSNTVDEIREMHKMCPCNTCKPYMPCSVAILLGNFEATEVELAKYRGIFIDSKEPMKFDIKINEK